jgi:hypothetical protein
MIMVSEHQHEHQTVSLRQNTFTKFFHEFKGQFDFTDADEFRQMMEKLTDLKKETVGNQQRSRKRKHNNDQNQNEIVEFPNTTFGRKDSSKCE